MASMEMVKNTVMVSLIFFNFGSKFRSPKAFNFMFGTGFKKIQKTDTKSELPTLSELIFELNFFLPFYF